jgi:hypothetical protein
VGGNWQTNIVTQTKYADFIALPAETIAFNDLPAEIYSTDTTLKLNVDYAINTQRKLLVALISPFNDTVAIDSTILNKEENTIPVNIELPDTLIEDTTYYVQLELWSYNEVPEYLIDSVKNEIRVLADTTTNYVNSKASRLMVYSNPTQDILTIQPGQISSDHLQVDIYSITGILLYSEEIDVNVTNFQINVSHLPDGAYILKLRGYQAAVFFKK